MLTSLRLTWTCRKAARTNISIGYNTITAVTTRTANSRLKGKACRACRRRAFIAADLMTASASTHTSTHTARMQLCIRSLAGSSTALHVLTKQHTQRFEFIFTALDGSAAALVAAVSGLVAAYEGSRPYRELRLRGAQHMCCGGRECMLSPAAGRA